MVAVEPIGWVEILLNFSEERSPVWRKSCRNFSNLLCQLLNLVLEGLELPLRNWDLSKKELCFALDRFLFILFPLKWIRATDFHKCKAAQTLIVVIFASAICTDTLFTANNLSRQKVYLASEQEITLFPPNDNISPKTYPALFWIISVFAFLHRLSDPVFRTKIPINIPEVSTRYPILLLENS